MSEQFNMFEARLAVAQASATGQDPYTAWNTASGVQANTAVWAYIKSIDINSAQSLVSVPRGLGDNRLGHFKPGGVQSIKGTLTFYMTGQLPVFSAYNAAVPMMMWEVMRKQTAGSNSAYTQLMGVAFAGQQEAFAADGNTLSVPFEALAMLNTGSGYIMT